MFRVLATYAVIGTVLYAAHRATRYAPPNKSVAIVMIDGHVTIHTTDQRLTDHVANLVRDPNNDEEWYDRENTVYMEYQGHRGVPRGTAKIVFMGNDVNLTASNAAVTDFMMDALEGKYRVNVV